MTVNERLCVAGLLDAFNAAEETDDLALMNSILAKVNLRRDADGMNYEVANDA